MRLLGYFFSILGIFLLISEPAFAQQDTSEPNATTQDQQQEPNDQSGDFRYISDDLFTYLRSGPGTNYRLLGSVNAGTKIQLLQVDNEKGYAEVIDNRQRTGWIETRFISPTPSIRNEFKALQVEVKEKEQSRLDMQKKLEAATQNLSKSDEQKSSLNRQVTQQLEDIARLKEQFEQRERANSMEWFTRGAILAIIALVLGYFMGLIGRKRKNSNRLM